MTWVALNWAVLEFTGSALYLGLINACRLVPAFLLSVPAGLSIALMDRGLMPLGAILIGAVAEWAGDLWAGMLMGGGCVAVTLAVLTARRQIWSL